LTVACEKAVECGNCVLELRRQIGPDVGTHGEIDAGLLPED